jgi:nitroreductase
MDALEALKTRRSVRRYTKDPVPKEVLEDLVDCARFAATARNEQPWEFVVVTERARLGALAKTVGSNGPFIADAAACVVVLCHDTKYYLEDGSAAVQNLLVAARAHGLGSCWVAGDKKPYAPEVARSLGAPADVKLIALVPVGRPAETPRAVKRSRSAMLHWERFS